MHNSEVILRPATAADFPAIRALIRRVRINPYGLDWRRFLVAVDTEASFWPAVSSSRTGAV